MEVLYSSETLVHTLQLENRDNLEGTTVNTDKHFSHIYFNINFFVFKSLFFELSFVLFSLSQLHPIHDLDYCFLTLHFNLIFLFTCIIFQFSSSVLL